MTACKYLAWGCTFAIALGLSSISRDSKCVAQTPAEKSAPARFDDHQDMMNQLGVTKLRPGKNGNNQTGDGFDEATANPWKETMPDALTMKNGAKVTSADQWPKRRAEILEDFEREVYGRIPENVPKVTWEVTGTTEGETGGVPTVSKTLVGHVDNSSFPTLTVNIQANFTVPANVKEPIPLVIEFGGFGGFGGGRGGPAARGPAVGSWQQQAIAHGWGYGSINPGSIQPDNNQLRTGIIGLTNKGEPRKPDDWGALRAWQWGVSRLIDYFEQNPDAKVDPKKIGIEGVSRYGKAALVAEAFEPRVAVAFVASSGEGGAKLHRHNFGEAVENLTGGEYYWMAGNFIKYGADEPVKKTAGDLPVDSHELIALCAPRPCFISYGIPNPRIPGSIPDPAWVDAHGSFMAGVLAGPVYKLLGKQDFGTTGDYLIDKMPEVGQLIGGELAWRQHEGGHDARPNFPTFFDWVARYVKAPAIPEARAQTVGTEADAQSKSGGSPAKSEGDTGKASTAPKADAAKADATKSDAVKTEGMKQDAAKADAAKSDAAKADSASEKSESPATVTARVNTAIVPKLNGGFMARHNQNVEVAKKGDIDLLFMGDSITDWWRSGARGGATGDAAPYAGKPVFDKYFGSKKAANFGIAGDTTQGVLWRLQNGEGEGFKPKAIMLMIGTNNTGRNTPQEIAMGVAQVVGELRKDFPDAKILLLGVFPRGLANDKARGQIADINKMISALNDGDHVTYLDIGAKFLAEDGSIPTDVMSDHLHPTTKGYTIWAEAVKEPLEKMMQ